MDLDDAELYRPAFALADLLREADSQNHPGRWRSNPAAGGTVEAIVAEVLGRLQVFDRGCAKLVR
jgi:hypothetical protein